MNLRTNTTLKFFAILLFSFEMIAPALITPGTEVIRHGKDTQLYSNEGLFTNIISSVLCEENNGEEERESKDHKNPLSFCELDLSNLLARLTPTETSRTLWMSPHDIAVAQRPLFTLFHSYLI